MGGEERLANECVIITWIEYRGIVCDYPTLLLLLQKGVKNWVLNVGGMFGA